MPRRHSQAAEAADPGPIGATAWVAVGGACLATLVGLGWGLTPYADLPALGLGLASCAAVLHAFRLLGRGAGGSGAARWRLGAAALALAAALVASTIASPDRFSALFGTSNNSEGLLQLLAVLGLVSAGALSSTRLRRALAEAAPFLLAVEVIVVLVQLMQGREPAGTLGHSSAMGQAIVLTLPFVVGSLFDADGRPRPFEGNRARWALVPLAVVTLGAAETFLAAGVAIAYLAWVAVRAYRRRRKGRTPTKLERRATIAVVATISVGAVVAMYRFVVMRSWASFASYRYLYWDVSARIFSRSPWLGQGPDTFRQAAGRFASARMIENGPAGLGRGFSQITLDPHALPASILTGVGIVGALAALWFGFEVVRNWRRQAVAGGGRNDAAHALVLFVLTLLTGPAPLMTLVLAATVAAASLRPERMRDEGVPARLAGASTWAVLGAGAAAAALTLLLAGTHLAIGPLRVPTEERRADLATTAARVWSIDPYLHYAASWLVAGADGAAAARGTDLTEVRRAIELAPDDPYFALEYARALASRGADRGETSAAYRRAIALFPHSYEARLAYGRYLFSLGEAAKARPYADAALRYGPLEPDAHALAADVAERLGETAVAARERAEAKRLQEARERELATVR